MQAIQPILFATSLLLALLGISGQSGESSAAILIVAALVMLTLALTVVIELVEPTARSRASKRDTQFGPALHFGAERRPRTASGFPTSAPPNSAAGDSGYGPPASHRARRAAR